MIRVSVGDLFESSAQTLVNTVNCVGVMGKGIALEFKKRFPHMYEDYVARCAAGQVKLGEPYLYRTLFDPWILNFPTKEHWRSVSRLSDIVAGLEYLQRHFRAWGIESLAVPPLGCGQGQLEWRVVGPTLFRYLEALEIHVDLYAPDGTPPAQLDERFLRGSTGEHMERIPEHGAEQDARINPAWVALVEIVARIEREPYHWPVGRIMFQKIAYFATISGIPTALQFARGSYGPFAPDLKTLMVKLVNNGLLHEERNGRMFLVKTGPTYRHAALEYRPHLHQWEPAIDHIADLFLRMRGRQAEIAATVHFAVQALDNGKRPNASEVDVLQAVKEWKQRRDPPLDDHEVAQTIRGLNMLGWIHLEPSASLPVPEDSVL